MQFSLLFALQNFCILENIASGNCETLSEKLAVELSQFKNRLESNRSGIGQNTVYHGLRDNAYFMRQDLTYPYLLYV